MKKLIPALVLALVLVLLFVALFLRVQAQKAEPGGIVLAEGHDGPTPAPTPSLTPEPTPTPTPYVSPKDFEALWQQNRDICAWLEIPNTTVDFPVLRHPEVDEYYLNRNLDGTPGLPGCVFTFSDTPADFSGFNTILYAHNMADGSMFGALKAYRDMDYLMAHRTIYLYTPEAKLTYTVFASTVFDDILIPAVYDETRMDDRMAYLQDVINSPSPEATVPGDMTIALEDHILTLSTCVDDMPENRRLVVALLTDIEPEWRTSNY